MLTCYVTPEEFRTFYNVGTMAKDANILTALRAATHDIEATLRGRGYATASLQPPEMFDNLKAFESATHGTTHTSAALTAEGGRFVVDVVSGTGTFTLEGTMDGTTWLPVRGMDGAPIAWTNPGSETFTALVLQRFAQYRYTVEPSGDCTFRAFMVDTGPDRAIRARTCYLVLFPYADKDTTIDAIVQVAVEDYRDAMDSLNLLASVSVDSDGDGITDGDDVGTAYTRRYTRMYR